MYLEHESVVNLTGRCVSFYLSLSYSFDYVEIFNQKYCGKMTGTTIEISGDYAVIRFHSDSSVQGGFSLLFSTVLSSV